MSRYSVRQIHVEDLHNPVIVRFIAESALHVSALYGEKFEWRNMSVVSYVADDRIVICFRDGEPVGLLATRLIVSVFDPKTKILIQDLLFAKSGSRASYYLLKDLIDFGKLNANHVITMIAANTNVKPATLERYGFKKLETLYRLET